VGSAFDERTLFALGEVVESIWCPDELGVPI
jgi:hypothetical protein